MPKNKEIIIKTIKGYKNWGDAANFYFVKTLTGTKPKIISIHENVEDPFCSYLIIGSVLGYTDKNSIVWGSGFILEDEKIRAKPKKIYAVSGPLSREIFLKNKISCPKVFGDPVLLFPRFYNPKVKKVYKLGIVPHEIDKDNPWLKKKFPEDVKIIDIEGKFKQVIKDVLSCEKIASSSLHGIILADAYNIPSLWLEFSDKVIGQGFKFRDYFLAVGRKDRNPLIVQKKTSISKIFRNFTDYKIKIDLDKLWRSCPFKDFKKPRRLVKKAFIAYNKFR